MFDGGKADDAAIGAEDFFEMGIAAEGSHFEKLDGLGVVFDGFVSGAKNVLLALGDGLGGGGQVVADFDVPVHLLDGGGAAFDEGAEGGVLHFDEPIGPLDIGIGAALAVFEHGDGAGDGETAERVVVVAPTVGGGDVGTVSHAADDAVEDRADPAGEGAAGGGVGVPFGAGKFHLAGSKVLGLGVRGAAALQTALAALQIGVTGASRANVRSGGIPPLESKYGRRAIMRGFRGSGGRCGWRCGGWPGRGAAGR